MGIMSLKLFLNAIIRNKKIKNTFDIIEISKYIKPNKCIQKQIYENFHLSVSFDFSNLDGFRKIKM